MHYLLHFSIFHVNFDDKIVMFMRHSYGRNRQFLLRDIWAMNNTSKVLQEHNSGERTNRHLLYIVPGIPEFLTLAINDNKYRQMKERCSNKEGCESLSIWFPCQIRCCLEDLSFLDTKLRRNATATRQKSLCVWSSPLCTFIRCSSLLKIMHCQSTTTCANSYLYVFCFLVNSLLFATHFRWNTYS